MVEENREVRVRAATRDDIPAIVAVETTSVTPEEVAGFGTPGTTNPFRDERRLAAAWADPNHVGNQEVFVADVGGRVVGFLTLQDRGEDLELVDIEIARPYQRHGIGTRMVASVEARARAAGKEGVTLGTSRNAAGVPWSSFPWWRSRGYHVTGEEENDWTRAIGPGVREIRMRKELGFPARIELRDVDPTDLPFFFEMQRDPAANRMAAFTAEDPSDRAAFEEHWARVLSDPEVSMKTIVLAGRVVGHVGRYIDREMGHPEVTYWVARACWGRGIASGALAAFLRDESTRPIYARSAADNVASGRVLEKCGFVPTGRGRGFANARGAETEEILWVRSEP